MENEDIFIECDEGNLKFTNSCWEVQRINPMHGGSILIDELLRFRHIGSGKFLAVDEDTLHLTLTPTSNSLQTLFVLRNPNGSTKQMEWHHEKKGAPAESKLKRINGNSRLLIQSFLSEKFLQMMSDDIEQDLEAGGELDQVDEVSQRVIVSHDYQKKKKNNMLFQIEIVKQRESIYSYQSSSIFDELLEFYAFMNLWAVSPMNQEEKTEQFYLNHLKAQELIP